MDARKILPNTPGMLEEAVPQGSHTVTTTLSGDRFGAFGAIGAKVSHEVSGQEPRSFSESLQSRKEMENDLAQLIEAGDIKMTNPTDDPSKVNLFKADGEPNKGVVRWMGFHSGLSHLRG